MPPNDNHYARYYTAYGPADVAFGTDPARGGFEKGVDVVGKSIGVRGVSANGDSDQDYDAAGVVGDGTLQGPGVQGRSQQHAGVQGFSDNGPGVAGVGSPGVVGSGAVGVFGEAYPSTGIGVRGISKKGFGVLGESTAGAGVKGSSDGKGNGIFGESATGAGVSGYSRLGRGGIFESDLSAQLQLVPRGVGLHLPKKGQAGDLMAITRSQATGDDRPRLKAELWFCTEGVSKGRDAVWGRVKFEKFA